MKSVLCVRHTKTFATARLFATRLAAAVLCGAALTAAPGVEAADNVLSFDDRGERVATTGRAPGSDFTIEAWFKLSAYTSENQIFSQYQGGHNGRLIAGIRNQVAGMFIGGVGSWHEGTATIPLDTWTHFAMTRSGSACVLYINGNVYLAETITANTLPDANFLIGNITDTGPGFRGEISDVRIWNSVRSQSEISSLKNVRLTGSESDLKHYWRLNEGSGNSVADLVDSEDGTIYGALWNLSLDLPILDSMPNAGAWSAATGGNWSNSDNWIDSSVPNGVDVMAYFTNRPPTAVTITNDMGALKLGQIEIGGSSGHTLTGSALLFTNNTDASSITATEGSHTIDLPLTTTQGELRLQTQEAAALTITDVISGASAISCNPYLAGGGSIIQQAAHNYTGITTLGCGMVEISTLPDGGAAGPFGASSSDPSNLILGPGTLRYTGADVTTDRGYTVNTFDVNGNSARAVVFNSDANVTFAGAIRATAGPFIKTGAGTLSYTYPGWNKFMANEGNPNGLLDIKDNGDSPNIGFSGFTIAEGKVALGVPGQINIFSNRVDIGMYTTTNANSEHSAELEINDGVFICNTTLSIGRNNGNTNTAPAGTTSKLTINGGECYLALVASGHNALSQPGFNPRSVYEINGGYVEQSRTVNIGEHAGSQITMNANGGHLNVKAGGASIRIGAGTGEGTLNMRGDAVVEAAGYIALALGDDPASKGTCNLNGGTLIANDIRKGNGVSAIVNFNGTIFKPNAGDQILDGLTAAYVSTNGAVFDTTLADYTVEQALLHDPELGATTDGGLTKTGSGTLNFNAGSATYNGDTVVSNGVLRLQTTLPGNSDLIVAPEGEVAAEGNPSVSTLTIETGGTLGFGFAADGTLNDILNVTADASLGTAKVALYLDDSDLPFTKNGTYTIMTYSGTTPDVSGLSCANPVFGKLYTFVADSGTVTVTIANDSAGASIWDVNGSGNWATGSNWTLAQPGTAGSTARFDDIITAPATVSTSGESAGALYFNSPYAYTIGGSGLTIDNSGAAAHLNVESGEHAITAPVTLNDNAHVEFSPGTALTLGAVSGATSTLSAQGEGSLLLSGDCAISSLGLNIPNLILSTDLTLTTDLELQRNVNIEPAQDTVSSITGAISGGSALAKTGSSVLELAGSSTYSGATTLSAGTIKVASLADGGNSSPIGAATAAPGNLTLGKGTLHITGAASTDRGYTVRTGSSDHAAVLRVDDEVTFGGQIVSDSGAFLKTGPGTVYYTYPGFNVMNKDNANRPGAILNIGDNGDAPTDGITGFTVTEGTVVFGAPGQTNQASRIDVGLRATGQAGQETAGEIIVNDGVLHSLQTVSIGRNDSTEYTAPGGVSSRLTVNGGICNFPILATGNNGVGLNDFNPRPVIEVTGGELNVGGNYLSVGEDFGSSATLLVSGGRVDIWNEDGGSLRMGGWLTDRDGGNGIVRLSGDGEILVNGNVEVGYGEHSETEFHLDGGTLSARNIIGLSGDSRLFYFNGGTFRPHTADQTMQGLTAAYVSTNGVVVDNSLVSYTIAQNLLTDPTLNGAVDGGLLKTGAESLTLNGSDNSFNGPVRVTAGNLRALLGGTNDLAVASGATFDALAANCAVGVLSGEGTLSNGTITVHGALDCGDSGAEAGAELNVANLTMAGGSSYVCDWSTNALGEATCDYVNVGGDLSVTGPGLIDFNREIGDPMPMPFEVEIMSYGSFTGSFTGWDAVGTGLPAETATATVVTAEDGVVTVSVSYSGLLMIVR